MSKGRKSGSGREDAASSRSSPGHDLGDFSRRDFLMRCCQGASAALVPVGLRRLAFSFASDPPKWSSPGGEFHLHPHYRVQLPLEATLLKTQAGLDDFVTEKYQDQIAAVLSRWSAGFMRSPQDVQAVEKTLAPEFLGASFHPVESRLARPSSALEIRRNKFAGEPALAREAFLRDMRSAMDSFSAVTTAEFQVTNIDAGARSVLASSLPSRLHTGVRYELVGSGRNFYREQRVGYWELDWES